MKLRTCSVCEATKTETSPKTELAKQPDFLQGDVDGNGKVNSADARLVLRASMKLEDYAEDSKAFLAADYNRGGTVKAEDARDILRVSVKLDPFKLMDPP